MHSRPEDELVVQTVVLLALHRWLKSPEQPVYITVSKDSSGKTLPFEDPSDDLILALFDHEINARPFSENYKEGRYYVDPVTKEQTYVLGIQHVHVMRKSQAQVKALFLGGDRYGATFTFLLKWDGQNWSVAEQKMTGMF